VVADVGADRGHDRQLRAGRAELIDDERYEQETREHIAAVREWMRVARDHLLIREQDHDRSKLEEPERSGFQAMTADARLKELTYGSDEYRAVLREHKPTIQHHYQENDHHPEHHEFGIRSMSLVSILEMLCDWKASTARMKDGDLYRSIEINAERFGYGPELTQILMNTARELGMIEP
jgi:hypothetical protein